MRKLGYVLALLGVLALVAHAPVYAQPAAATTFHGFPVVAVIVDGTELPVGGLVIDGVTYAPVRALAETLGSGVLWQPETASVAGLVKVPAAR